MADADEECDYMSDVFVSGSSDSRSSLLWGNHARKHEQEKKKKDKDIKNKRKPLKMVEAETRDKGLDTKLGNENKGFAMLQKMGYKPGEGLGKNKTGRVEPVPIAVKANKTGLGKDSHEKRKREAQEKFRTILMHKRRKYNESLQVDFRARMSGKFAVQQFEKDLRKSQKVCHQLDSEQGIDSPDFDFFWPVQALSQEEEEEECEKIEEEEEYTVEEKLFILTRHLRENFFYCLWCSVRYDDDKDLSNNCPGENAKDHDD
ncbi:G patch domain-containing protein 11-like isoform X2 [Styela clava]